jgi:hypothetical protein
MVFPILNAGHLERCPTPGCRKFILDTDVRCTHCGVDRPSFKVFKASFVLGKYLALPALALVAIIALTVAAQKQVNAHRDQVEFSR